MKKIHLKILALSLCLCCCFSSIFPICGENVDLIDFPTDTPTENNSLSDTNIEEGSLRLECKSAILMEATTGTVLYLQNPDEALPPASVTKIMTLLLIMEAVDAGTVHLEDLVTVSSNAASMGGSQVYLKEGEQMPVEDLLKSVVIASANDAAVALAEHIAGSVSTFVERMNAKAKALGMHSTLFENVTGLDDTAEAHLTSARDIALMSRALLTHPTILQYSSIWMDTIRNGEFGLTNTNRLVRFYRGCTGLKTGSTSKAGFCVSATAERDGLSLICVIMGAESRDIRNAQATALLDWGFANYGLYTAPQVELPAVPLVGGTSDQCRLVHAPLSKVVPKEMLSQITYRLEIPEALTAPIEKGDSVGSLHFLCGDKVIGTVPIIADESIPKINFFEILYRMTAKFLLI